MRHTESVVLDKLLGRSTLSEQVAYTDKLLRHGAFLRKQLRYRASESACYLMLFYRNDRTSRARFAHDCFFVPRFDSVHAHQIYPKALPLSRPRGKKRTRY